MNLGEIIREKRKERGLTQKELANMTGLAEITIRQYEAGKFEPRRDTVQKLQSVLGPIQLNVAPGAASHDSPLDFELSWLKNGGGAHLGNDTGREALALHRFRLLNEAGQRNALDLLELVTKIPEYRK